MPHISIKMSRSLNAEQEQDLVARLGELISLIPGKTEKSLMASVACGRKLFHGGVAAENGCYMEVKLFRSCPRDAKENFVNETVRMLEDDYGVSKEHLYINFFEIDNWASGGRLL